MGVRLDKYTETATKTSVKNYQQQIGSLIYLITSTRPDISFSVGQYARFISNLGPSHFRALQRIWQYLIYSRTLKLISDSLSELILTGYCDSDWGGDFSIRKLTTGYLFLFGNSAVLWLSKL